MFLLIYVTVNIKTVLR